MDLTDNGFKDRRLAPQIIKSLFDVLRPRSHAAKETSQEVTHPKLSPEQSMLNYGILTSELPEKKGAPFVI